MSTLQDALVFVFNADDHEVNRLFEALKERRKQLRVIANHEALATFKRGDRVELHGLSPKYLNGATGTIERLDGNKFSVRFDEHVNRGRYGPTVLVPASCLTALTTTA